jgi:serine/threonine protein kinase
VYSFIYLFSQPWPSISHLAKDFIDKLLILEASHRMSAGQALDHPWVISMAAGASMKNLQRAISRNLRWRASPSSQSPRSAESSKSCYSYKVKHMWSQRELGIAGSPLSALLWAGDLQNVFVQFEASCINFIYTIQSRGDISPWLGYSKAQRNGNLSVVLDNLDLSFDIFWYIYIYFLNRYCYKWLRI